MIKKSSRSTAGENFPNFELLDARIASASNKIDHPEFPLQEKGQSGTEKLRKKIGSLKTDRLHDPRLLPDLFSVTLHDNNIQEFDTRWDEVPLSMSKIPPTIPWKARTN